MKTESKFNIGDRVESNATFEHNRQRGTVIDLKKPHYVQWGTLSVPLNPVVQFDNGDIVVMKDYWVNKVKE